MRLMSYAVLFLAGWLYVGIIEYLYHRFLLHSGHHAVHNAHHEAFFTHAYDDGRLLNHWAFVAVLLHLIAFFALLPRSVALTLSLSTLTYLAALELGHAWIHGHPKSWFARWHIAHHRNPRHNFNVFLPTWDYLLGTRRV